MDPPVFITTTVKLKEFKINAEDDELPPTSGIKNAGMVKKTFLRPLMQYLIIAVTVVVTTLYSKE